VEKIKVICDTDVMIDYLDHLQSRHNSSKQFLENAIGLDLITLSAITKMELMAGALNKTALSSINKNINRFNILLINPEITSIALHLVESYKLSHNLAIPDSLIAATAIHTGLELFTFNVRDFKFIPGLQLYQNTH
jgi:predicted nucleic acid-binding protein